VEQMDGTTRTGAPDRSNAERRVLVLDEEIPWPLTTGKRIRTWNLLSALSSEFAIDLLVHDNGASEAALQALAERDITVRVAPSHLPLRRGPGLPVGIALSLCRRLPYSVYSHYRRAYQREMLRLIDHNHYGLVHCEWTPYALYLESCSLPVIIAAHNVEWRIWDRLAATERRWAHRRLFAIQARLMRAFECRVLQKARSVTAVSTGDAEALRALGAPEVVEVPNGVDVAYYSPAPASAAGHTTLVFTGSMDWRPNQDAIRWFIDEVHPLLQRQTDYRLLVVGRQPPAWLTEPGQIPREVEVTGTVEDVRPWIARGSLFVVPLRAGGGSRLKILEAMAMARPVVSTTVGAEGLELTEGVHVVRADTASDFAHAVAVLLRDPRRRAALADAGRRLVEERYSWSRIAPIQADVWRRAMPEGHSR
jgi:glycosyltransferase involved in cell wall biosynthesis